MQVVFILTSSVNTNSIKRIDEFVTHGFNVKAYGFKRELDVPNKSKCVEIEILGKYKNDLPYYKRCAIIYKGIRRVLKETSKQSCVYYLIGLDVAMFFRLQSRRRYIFEEADLVHANFTNKLIKNTYELIDKAVIRRSLISAFRSEGFLKYHFGEDVPENVHVISNRLNVGIKDFNVLPKHPVDLRHIKIGYVGFIRYESIAYFAKCFCSHFPQHEFHFYGTYASDGEKVMFKGLDLVENCFFHGSFKSPDDLNKIYSQIDMVLSTYDVSSENVRYAEPNKIYEAIYFETPIIVSSGTFLADKVKKLGIGYDIDALDEHGVVHFVDSLTEKSILDKIANARAIDKREALNVNDELFEKLEKLLCKD